MRTSSELPRVWYNLAVNQTIQPIAAFAAFLLSLSLISCSGTPRPEASAKPGGDAEAGAQQATGAQLARVLDAALARKSWDDLRLHSECRDEERNFRTTKLFGTGVGIWNQERQFPVSRERLLSLLDAVRRSGFSSMPESFGGDKNSEPDWKLQMTCRVRVTLDGVEQQAFQLSEGSQSAELKALAEQILAVGAELGPSGVGAGSLEDGLWKIYRGELAPEALTLQLLRQSEDPNASEGSFILRIEDGVAQVSLPSPETAWTVPRQVRLSREEAATLAGQLAATQPDDLPVNLYSTWYQDLEIRVLNQKKALQARRFANLTPETHGAKQKRFGELISAIEVLQQKVVEER